MVVGGGIGGLAAAIGLHRIGWQVTVVERASTLEDAGAGISLAANGLRALDELGVGEAVRNASRGQYSGGTRTPRGAERRPRGQAVARAARQAGRMGQQLSHPVAIALRNTAMRLTPSRAATRMILRHHAWVPPRLD
ncbi:hypothetical protein A6A28_15815 [Streptomyces sp. CB03578]|nr:hypothetical protein A6A28_15815 [Streptomyces sp. CB03578]